MHPVAPDNLSSVAYAWNATVSWKWKYNSYLSLALVCEIDFTSQGFKTNVSTCFFAMSISNVQTVSLFLSF